MVNGMFGDRLILICHLAVSLKRFIILSIHFAYLQNNTIYFINVIME